MKDQLDYWLSKVTMYRLVTLCLSALLGVALLVALTGQLGFAPWLLLVSVAILLAATYGSGRLFGWLFGVRPHGESSIITALILACLFFPPISVLAAVKLVLVGCFASASKYLIAIRGRHILNPAATAAVIASVTGLAGAAWWIATPALLPVALIIALLILYKTRRLQMGVLFMLLATILVTISAMLFGTAFVPSLLMAIESWPIVFLAGVMLSEPLTQPPRRWQQLSITVLIAVLMVVPLRTPVIAMTPALALLIGNAVSWYWGSRRALKLTFVKKVQLTPSSYEFVFTGNVPFVAGQYIELTLPHHGADSRGVRRVFTIAASPGDKTMRFGIKIPERHSTFKQALTQLQEGTVVAATRVAGDFVLPAETARPILFVAGGIGITPLISYVRSYTGRNIVLVYAVSSPAEIAYRDVLAVAGIRVIVVTPVATIDDIPGGWEVIDGAAVTPEILQKAVPDIRERMVYISGPPLMVNAVKRTAKKLGARAVKTDHFAGY
jgi:ferredoxin-NADP reductase